MVAKLVLVCVLFGIVAAERNANYYEIAHAFERNYKAIIESEKNLDHLGTLYKNDSLILFESNEYTGIEDVIDKYKASKVTERIIKSFDSLATNDGNIINLLIGEMKYDNDDLISFVQVFYLKPDADSDRGNMYCSDEIFRITTGL